MRLVLVLIGAGIVAIVASISYALAHHLVQRLGPSSALPVELAFGLYLSILMVLASGLISTIAYGIALSRKLKERAIKRTMMVLTAAGFILLALAFRWPFTAFGSLSLDLRRAATLLFFVFLPTIMVPIVQWLVLRSYLSKHRAET